MSTAATCLPPAQRHPLDNHMVQRLDYFVGDAGLGDRNQLVHGLWVDDGKEANYVA